MDVDPPRWKNRWKLDLLWYLPLEPRKKIKKFIKLGDEYRANGEEGMAVYCYERSLNLARSARAVHLLKKVEERFQ
jgi:hypothetical protein